MSILKTKTKILLLAHDSLQNKLGEFIWQNVTALKRFQLIYPTIQQEFLKLLKEIPFNPLQWEELDLDPNLLETTILNQNIAGVNFFD